MNQDSPSITAQRSDLHRLLECAHHQKWPRGEWMIQHRPELGFRLAAVPKVQVRGTPGAFLFEAAGQQRRGDWEELEGLLGASGSLFGIWDYEALLAHSGLKAGDDVEGAVSLFVPEVIVDANALDSWEVPHLQAPTVVEVDRPVFRPQIDFEIYRKQVLDIRELIRKGDVYEVNLTFEVRGPPLSLIDRFERMVEENPSPYAAYYKNDEREVASISPELFFEVRGETLVTRPMKGTRARPNDPDQAALVAEELRRSRKDRAENLMIVDLCRNDLTRVCQKDSVTASRVCEIESHPQVLQMVSEVRGRLRHHDVASILGALGPGGSMTGAPKWTATDILRRLERRRRRAYAGAIGSMDAKSHHWSMGIRLVENDGECCRIGCGGAIVWDSTPEQEWEEALTKARSVVRALGGVLAVGGTS